MSVNDVSLPKKLSSQGQAVLARGKLQICIIAKVMEKDSQRALQCSRSSLHLILSLGYKFTSPVF